MSVPARSPSSCWDRLSGVPEPLGVAEALHRVNAALAGLGPLSVRGIVRDVRPARSGHLYLTLVDDTATDAALGAVIFLSARARVDALLARAGARLVDGALVVVRGRFNVWRARGSLSLVVEDVDVEAMLDARAAARVRALRVLEAEGLLALQRSLPLAAVPQRIALIASVTGVVREDVARALHRSGYRFHVELVHADVSHQRAAASLRDALRRAERLAPDVILIARGGGSGEDLAAFDDPELARAIAVCSIPVWCAIGHAVDRPLVTYVAQASYDVPQSAARALVERTEAFLAEVAGAAERCRQAGASRAATEARSSEALRTALRTAAQGLLHHARASLVAPTELGARLTARLRAVRGSLPDRRGLRRARARRPLAAIAEVEASRHHLVRAAQRALARHTTASHLLSSRLAQHAHTRLVPARTSVAQARGRLVLGGVRSIGRLRGALAGVRERVGGLSAPLAAGYAALATPEGSWLRRAFAVQERPLVIAHFLDGSVPLAPRPRAAPPPPKRQGDADAR